MCYNIIMEYIAAKTIVTKTKSSAWFGTDYNMNIYRGCSHGCIYCDSRSDCYRIEAFDRVRAKEDALRIIRDELARKVQTGVIGTGAMSDPYNPFEAEQKLTRHALELVHAFGFGIAITTKSPLVTRDIDVLCDIKRNAPALVTLNITAADDHLSKQIEPHVAPSSQRFAAVRKLSDAGLSTGVLLMPTLPFLTDTEENVLDIVHQAKESGARFVFPAFGVTLRSGQREYFYHKLDQSFPRVKEKYIKRYGDRYNCSSVNAKRLYAVLAEACHRLGLRYRMPQIVQDYKQGYAIDQLSLF